MGVFLFVCLFVFVFLPLEKEEEEEEEQPPLYKTTEICLGSAKVKISTRKKYFMLKNCPPPQKKKKKVTNIFLTPLTKKHSGHGLLTC